jgi:DNA-binding NarL/FixJ family response regulator
MTHVLFLPDEDTTIELESPLDPDALIDQVHCGDWELPTTWQKKEILLSAFRQDNRVIVLPVTVLEDKENENDSQGLPQLRLSPRQKEILEGIGCGLTLKEIALRMGISRRTVSAHISILKKRLGASTLAQSISRAQALGYYDQRTRSI